MRSLLYGVEPLDGASFGVAAGIVLRCSAAAAALPARRAAKVDPAVALREN